MIGWALLKSFPLMKACSEDDLRRLAAYCTAVSYRRFRPVYSEGAPSEKVCLVQKGEVVLHREEEGSGRMVRIYVAVAGDIFGIGEMLLKSYYTSATTMTDTTLLQVTNKDFIAHFLAVPSIRNGILLDFSQMIRIHIDRMVEHTGVHELALYLWHLKREHGKLVNGKVHIQIRVRQPEVGEMLNLSREHVTRLFHKLKLQGVVNFNKGYPIVDDAWLNSVVRDKDLAESIRYRTALM